MDMLARREHSVGELREKLLHKGYTAMEVAHVMIGLQRAGLVSDLRFSEMWLAARRGRGVGPLRIRMELRKKGVTEELIDQCLALAGSEWMEHMLRVRQKKYGSELPTDYAERARQARFLQSRGYTFAQIQCFFTFGADD